MKFSGKIGGGFVVLDYLIFKNVFYSEDKLFKIRNNYI